ncbi:MAG: glycosyltransferase [Salinibacter sp.]
MTQTTNAKTTNVLHLVNGEHRSGAERIQESLLQGLDRRRFTPYGLALMEGEFVRRAREVQLPMDVLPMRHRLDASIVPKLVRRMRELEIDLVHTHTVRTNLVGRLAARWDGRPVITHVHSPTWCETGNSIKDNVNHMLDRATRQWSSCHLCVSESLRDRLIADRVAPERLIVVHNGIEIDLTQPDPQAKARARECLCRQLGVDSSKQLITTTALFRSRKGTDRFVEMIDLLVQRGFDVCGVLIGPFESETYRRRIVELAREHGLWDSGRLVHLGFREDVLALIAAADAFVLPSLYGEGLPLVILEAMAVEVPIVSTRVEGVPEAIEHEWSGLLVPPDDPSALAEAVARLLADPAWARALGERARERVAASFTAEAMVRRVERVYDSVLESR